MNFWKKYNKSNYPDLSRVLVTNGQYVKIAEFGIHKEESYFRDETGIIDDVTDWKYLPEPPKKRRIKLE